MPPFARSTILRTGVACLALVLAGASAAAFDLQGHRGARGLSPENTLPAFEKALRTGVATLELDIGMTSDGVLVVSHDPKLNPDITRGPDGAFLTAPGKALTAMTLEELRSFDVGRTRPDSRTAKAFPEQTAVDGTRVPTLEEVFALAERLGAKDVRFNIETKSSPAPDAGTPEPRAFATALAKAIDEAGLGERATVQSFDWRTLMALKEVSPDIPRVCLTSEGNFDTLQRGKDGGSPWLGGLDVDDFDSVPALVAEAGCTTWSPNFRNLTQPLVEEAQEMELAVVPWTVNETDDMARLIGWGVDGLITDYPDRARTVMAAKGLPLPAPVAP